MSCSLKELMLKDPHIEYMGSCPGCPESVLARLLCQILGDSLQLTVAVGCSLVWAHFNLMRPLTINREGRCVPTGTSLFENGSVYCWGGVVGRSAQREHIRRVVADSLCNVADAELRAALEEYLRTFDEPRRNHRSADRVRRALGVRQPGAGAQEEVYAGTVDA